MNAAASNPLKKTLASASSSGGTSLVVVIASRVDKVDRGAMQRHHLTKVAVMKGVYGMKSNLVASTDRTPLDYHHVVCVQEQWCGFFPGGRPISDSNRLPIPERRTWPKGSTSPFRGGNVPSEECSFGNDDNRRIVTRKSILVERTHFVDVERAFGN